MYDWLQDTLDTSTCIVTANRRLARELQAAWSAAQVEAGNTAWQTPSIQPWSAWLAGLLASAANQGEIPTRINSHQSQVLWERCLRKELGEDTSGLATLVRLARDAWQRLADARVSIREVARLSRSEDQRLYAAAAGRYLAILDNERWVDDAGLAAEALKLVRSGSLPIDKRYVFAGFDRARASVTALQDALVASGCEIEKREATNHRAQPVLHEFEDHDAELRAAGSWARQVINAQPGANVAIVVHGLEQSAQRDVRLVREGVVPGWQYGPASLRDAVNVSYGRRLSDYPAVSIALLALRWLVRDLSSVEVSRLLQSPLLGKDEAAGRARLELRLRGMPDRAWSPSMLTSALRGKSDQQDGEDWLARIAAFSKRRRELPQYAAPAAWVMLVDDCLRSLGWPGPASRDSDDYQLVNRWRELLNEFARLDLVSSSMNGAVAIRQLERMAAETLFQPESRNPSVQLMGPLEAAGAEFDAIWIAGLTANSWPPPGNPSALVSRTLQVENGMPDATPDDTRKWAATTLQRLTGSAPNVVCSYALVEDDVAQTASDLVADLETQETPSDPGWHAAAFAGKGHVEKADDSIPPLVAEKIFGGAGTVQWQLSEPFSAFAFGRLGIRGFDPQALGIPALLRGNLVHDTLYRLYQGLPSAADLQGWDEVALGSAVAAAVDAALQRHLRNTDAVLRQLLQLERQRIVEVVTRFVEKDGQRGDFQVTALEGDLVFRHGTMLLSLRFDRVDRFEDGSVVIIDYKTGSAKQLLHRDGSVKEPQLFVYAAASEEPVAGLALANLDARATEFSGAGRGFTDEESFPQLLATAEEAIRAACDDLIAGDVRLIAAQGVAQARRLNVLSRYTELRRDS